MAQPNSGEKRTGGGGTLSCVKGGQGPRKLIRGTKRCSTRGDARETTSHAEKEKYLQRLEKKSKAGREGAPGRKRGIALTRGDEILY